MQDLKVDIYSAGSIDTQIHWWIRNRHTSSIIYTYERTNVWYTTTCFDAFIVLHNTYMLAYVYTSYIHNPLRHVIMYEQLHVHTSEHPYNSITNIKLHSCCKTRSFFTSHNAQCQPLYLQTSGASSSGKKGGRCKFCRSKAKYLPGQRSFDAAGIFGRRREQREPRRAVSEDQPREFWFLTI